MANKFLSIAMIGLLGLASVTAYRLVSSQLAAEVYRDRLMSLSDQYGQLREQYNEAVRRTAVTELHVKNGKLTVVVRTDQDVIKRVPTSFDPSNEIYVDYIVQDGRLWIRRVYSDQVAPKDGVTIDPARSSVDWTGENVRHGKAVYHKLDEGRWRVTVTGGGSLGLGRVEPGSEPRELTAAPQVGEYEPIEKEVDQRLDQIGWMEVVGRLSGWITSSAPEPEPANGK